MSEFSGFTTSDLLDELKERFSNLDLFERDTTAALERAYTTIRELRHELDNLKDSFDQLNQPRERSHRCKESPNGAHAFGWGEGRSDGGRLCMYCSEWE